jgi:hypothetical protein
MAEDDRTSGSRDDALAARGVRHRRQRFQERARMEYLQGAEQDSRRRLGRGLTVEELRLVLRLYPGD